MVKLESLKKATISNLFLNRKKLILITSAFSEQKALLKRKKESLAHLHNEKENRECSQKKQN